MEKVLVSGGELRVSSRESRRTYHFCVQPNGEEPGLNKCPALRAIGSSGGGLRRGEEEGGTRIWTISYELCAPFTLKMVCLASILGKRIPSVEIFIDVNEDDPGIEIYGFANHGYFKGRGKINTKLTKVSEDVLRTQHGYIITSPPLRVEKGERLIYW